MKSENEITKEICELLKIYLFLDGQVWAVAKKALEIRIIELGEQL